MWILCKLYIYVCVSIIYYIYYIILHIYIYVYIHCFTHIFSQKNWHLQLTSWGPHQRAGGVPAAPRDGDLPARPATSDL